MSTLAAGASPLARSSAAVAAASRVEEEITVSAQAAQSETASVTLLDADDIERAESRDAAQLLDGIAGVRILSAGSRGGTSYALLRGGDANFTLVLLDGIPLNDASDVQGGAFALATMGVDDLAGVEALRGPHSYFFGSSAVAGAINLVTRDGSGGPDGRLQLEAGESSQRRAGVSIAEPWGASGGGRDDGAGGGPDDRVGGGLYLAARHDEEAGAIGDDSFEQGAVHGAAVFDLGPRTRLHAVARGTDFDVADYPESSGGPLFGSGELRHGEGRRLALGLRLALGGESWRHGATASWSRADHEVDSPGVAPAVPPSLEDRSYTRAQLGWLSSGETTANLALSAGVQIDHERGSNASVLSLPPFLGGDLAGDYRLERTTPGVFAAAVWSRNDLAVEAGARTDDPEGLDAEWSPRFGLRYRAGESGLELHGAWSRAFKLASFFALASPPALGGNPDLLPETSESVELGAELRRRSGGLSVTLWSATYEDLVDFDFERFLHVNRSRVEAEGVELEGRWSPLESLHLSTAWTLQELDGPPGANVILHSPDWFGRVALEWSAAAALRLRAEARFADETEDVQIPVPELTRVAAYEVLDLAASWRPAERWIVNARVDNAADRQYAHFVGFPQPGRTARVGIQYDFR